MTTGEVGAVGTVGAAVDAGSLPVDMFEVATWRPLRSSVVRCYPAPPPKYYVKAHREAVRIYNIFTQRLSVRQDGGERAAHSNITSSSLVPSLLRQCETFL